MTRLRLRAALLTAVGALVGTNPASADDAVPPPPVAAPVFTAPAPPPCRVTTPLTPVPLGAVPTFSFSQLHATTPCAPQPGCTLTRLVTPGTCPTPVAADLVKAAPAGVSVVYKLRHAAAADVADALTKMAHHQKRDLTVVAEPVANCLLVAASPDQLKDVVRIVEKLDQEPPRVQVDVMLVRVPADFAEKAGLRQADTPAVFAGGLTDRERQMFTALLRQAKENGTLEVLSCPRLMMLDNQTGCFHCGGQYPCPSLEEGKDQQIVRMEPIGLMTKVTPRISPDGKVLLRIETAHREVCAGLGITKVVGGESVTVPGFTEQMVHSTVSLADGATVVLSGGTHTRQVKHLVAVPVLGNIPHLDKLFTNVTLSTEKYELLLVVTAHIVRPTQAVPVVPPMAAPIARPLPTPPTMMPTPPVVLRPAPPIRYTASVVPPPAVAPPMPVCMAQMPTPAPCCEAACGSGDKTKAAELVKAYRKACAAGDVGTATQHAVKALALDPTCFAPSK